MLQNADAAHRWRRWYENARVKTELELRHLRVFVAVVEAGAHTRAAKALGLSQSTVSETLSGLERTLGATLFLKGGRGPVLTAAGEALLLHARKILALTTELLTQVSKVSSTVNGTLRIAAVESLSAYALPVPLAALRERWPNVRLEVTTGPCAEIRAGVMAGKSDVGLVIETDTGLDDASVIAKVRLLVVASPRHPFAGAAGPVARLQGCDFYMSDAAGDYHQVLRQCFEQAQVPGPKTQALGTVEGVKRSLFEDAGAIGVLPAHAVERELRAGVLAEVEVTPALAGLVVRAIVLPADAESPVVAELVERLRTTFARPSVS